jgi:cytochrome P450
MYRENSHKTKIEKTEPAEPIDINDSNIYNSDTPNFEKEKKPSLIRRLSDSEVQNLRELRQTLGGIEENEGPTTETEATPEKLKNLAITSWENLLEIRKYKRFGEVVATGESLPCSGSVALDAIGFRLFNAQYIKWLFKQKSSDIVGLGVGFGSIFVKDPQKFKELVLQDPKAQRFGKKGEVHDLIRGTVGVENIVEEPLEDNDGFHGELRKITAPFTTLARHETLYKDIMKGHLYPIHQEWQEKFESAQKLGEEAEVDVGYAMKRFTMSAVTEAVMGVRDLDEEMNKLNNLEFDGKIVNIDGFDEIKDSIRKSAEWISSVVSMGGIYEDPKLKKEYEHAVAVINTYAAYVDQFAPNQHYDGEKTFGAVLHEMYPDVENDEELTKKNQNIRRAQIKGLTIAGFETTAPTMLAMVDVIGKNPKVERELYKTVSLIRNIDDALIDRPNDAELLASRRRAEEYLKDFWMEVTRFSPGIPMLSRTAKRDIETDATIAGKKQNIIIKEGEYVSISVDDANRNPEFWPKVGPSPEVFDPDRWAIYRELEVELKKNKKRLKTGYLTFSDGPTSCIGPKFSEAEAVEWLNWYFQQPYKLEFSNPNGLELNRDWIIAEAKEKEVMARLKPRDKNEFLDIDIASESKDLIYKPKQFKIPGLEELAAKGDIEEDDQEDAPQCPFHKILRKKSSVQTDDQK